MRPARTDPFWHLAETPVDIASRACLGLELLRPTVGVACLYPSMPLASKIFQKMLGYVVQLYSLFPSFG